MMPVTLAWRNLWRNRRRTLITLLAITFGVALAQVHQNLTHGFFLRMIDNGVRAGSGHLAIHRQQFLEKTDQALAFPSASLLDNLRQLPEISEILPRIHLSALAQSSRESRGVMLLGVEAEEFRVNPYLKALSETSRLRPDFSSDAVVGSRLAAELGLSTGDKFVVTVQNQNGGMVSELFRVRGIMASGLRKLDRFMVAVNRGKACELLGKPGTAHQIAIILKDQSHCRAVVQSARKLLSAHPELELAGWEETMPGMAHAMRLNSGIESFELFLLLTILAIGIVNTLLMSVMERIREFGVLQAIGATSGWVVRLIFTEAFLLGMAGMLLGSLLGCLLTLYFIHYGLDLRPIFPENMEFGGVVYEPVIYAAWSTAAMLRLGLYLMMLSLLASVFPAIKILRSSTVEALKSL